MLCVPPHHFNMVNRHTLHGKVESNVIITQIVAQYDGLALFIRTLYKKP